jgi:hypothetical protein
MKRKGRPNRFQEVDRSSAPTLALRLTAVKPVRTDVMTYLRTVEVFE